MPERRRDLGEFYLRDKTLRLGEGHPPLCHRAATLTLVTRGTLLEQSESDSLSGSPFTLVWKPPGLRHSTTTQDQATRMLILGVPRATVRRVGLHRLERPFVSTNARTIGHALRLFDEAFRDASRSQPGSQSVLHLAAELARCAAKEHEPASTGIHSIVRSLIRELKEPAAGTLSVGELADRIGVHRVHLARSVRRDLGCTPKEVLRRRRLGLAVQRLALGGDSLASIALELGYFDQSHFCNEFHSNIGWTPTQFRQTARRW